MNEMELFINNQKLITFGMKRATANHSHWFKTYHYDDIRQHATIGLYKACKNYDEQQGEFSTYAITCILREISNYVEQVTRYRRKDHATAMYSLEDKIDDKHTIADTLEYQAPEDVSWIWTDRRLTYEQQTICKLLYEGYTQEEIGNIIGCSRAMVNKKIMRIRKIFKEDNDV